jgi:uncharacterized protein YbjT (DUF2867 family)
MENILVAGANGTTGKKVVDLLKNTQYFNPVAMVRKEKQLNEFKNRGIDAVLADLEEDVSHALNNIHKVIFAAGSGGRKVVAVDQEGAKKLVDAAKNRKVKKIVMLSSMGAENPQNADELKDYIKAKHNADEYLKDSGLNYTIVRPGSLNDDIGSGKISLQDSFEEQGEINRNDVAQTLVRSLHDDVANKKTFEILSGDTLIGKALDNISA